MSVVIRCMERDMQRCNSMILDDLYKIRTERKINRNGQIIKKNKERFKKARCACGCGKIASKSRMHAEMYRNKSGYTKYQIKWFLKSHKPNKREIYVKRDE